MFTCDETAWPVLRFSFEGGLDAADEAAYLAALDALAARLAERSGDFVLVARMDGASPLSPPGRKRQALWFKQHRDLLGRFCRGFVRLRGGTAPAGFGNDALARALPFPLRHAESEDEAMALARDLLGQPRTISRTSS